MSGYFVRTLLVVAIMLDARGPETGDAVLLDQPLPRNELFDGKRVAPTRVLQADEPGTYARDDNGFAPRDPTLRIRRRKVGFGQRRSASLGLRFQRVSLVHIGHGSMLGVVGVPKISEGL